LKGAGLLLVSGAGPVAGRRGLFSLPAYIEMDPRSVMYGIVAVVILLILVVVAVLGAQGTRRYAHYLSGLWVGESEFLERANLSDFQVFLSPEDGGRRQGYLLVADAAGNIVANQAFEFWEESGAGALSAMKAGLCASGDVCTADAVRFEYDGAGPATPMPATVKMSLSVLDGTLTFFDDKKVYAFLVKDLNSSSVAVRAYSRP
jgi:hypothetical protein